MPSLLLAGDIHGDVEHLTYLAGVAMLRKVDGIVALGDFGLNYTPEFVERVGWVAEVTGKPFLWLDGNHDNHQWINERLGFLCPDRDRPVTLWPDHPDVLYLPRGCVYEFAGKRVMALGGAYSTDQHRRTQGVDWWPEETVSYGDVERACARGPVDVMLTHDAPYGVVPLEETLRMNNERQDRASAANRHAVAAVVEACQPRLLVHGHYHRRYAGGVKINGRSTTVVGLDRNTTGAASWEVLNL